MARPQIMRLWVSGSGVRYCETLEERDGGFVVWWLNDGYQPREGREAQLVIFPMLRVIQPTPHLPGPPPLPAGGHAPAPPQPMFGKPKRRRGQVSEVKRDGSLVGVAVEED